MSIRNGPETGKEARRLARARIRLADIAEAALALLDTMDGDPDREPDGFEELSVQPELRGGALVRAA